MISESIQEHNLKPAGVWSSAGKNYDNISRSISDAIEHCVSRLNPQPGEKILDVPTGTGWAARRIAEKGAVVTGVDYGKDLIESAKEYSSGNGHHIDYYTGDAESLAFGDESFDAVISTFGVMFVSNPEAAAGELARVCKKGGRIALTTWRPDSTIFGMFKVMKPYMSIPSSPPPSPFEWGAEKRVIELLGEYFDLKFESGTTVMRLPDGEDAWNLFSNGYGPTKTLASSLDKDKAANLRQEFINYHNEFKNGLGVSMPREYLVTVGYKKG